jgi:hypothetical protein
MHFYKCENCQQHFMDEAWRDDHPCIPPLPSATSFGRKMARIAEMHGQWTALVSPEWFDVAIGCARNPYQRSIILGKSNLSGGAIIYTSEAPIKKPKPGPMFKFIPSLGTTRCDQFFAHEAREDVQDSHLRWKAYHGRMNLRHYRDTKGRLDSRWHRQQRLELLKRLRDAGCPLSHCRIGPHRKRILCI